MDSFELNKIIGAILGTLLFVMGSGFLAEAIYSPIEGRGDGYELPGAVEDHGGGEEEEVVVDIGTLLAAANAEQGEMTARKCAGCHNFAEGAGNKQGPELYGVVGRPIASHAGFTYSDAMKAHASETWTYERLNAFLLAPKTDVPETKMNFPGLKNDEERANVIAYLSTLSASPVPFPAPAPAAPATAEAADAHAAPAEGEAVATDADAVATPTETQSETPVEGTATTSGAGSTEAPAEGTAPAGETVPEVPAQ
jgi:cytochrome c